MPIRTRACYWCRRKRIKCDATLPHCLQCIRAKRACPGPIQGPLIVDMTLATETRAQKKKEAVRKEFARRCKPQEAHFAPPLAIGLPLSPSEQSVAGQAFFAKFLDYFTPPDYRGSCRAWMKTLHELPMDQNGPLALATRAASTAFCALDSAKPAVLRDACMLYGKALHAHSLDLAASQDAMPAMDTIATSVMLSIFEAMQGTPGKAYINHIRGALKMLEMVNLTCRSSVSLKDLYYHVRVQNALLALLGHGGEPHAPDPYLELVAFSERIPLFQRLVSYMVILLDFYSPSHKFRPRPAPDSLTILKISSRVEALWAECASESPDNFHALLRRDAQGRLQYIDGFTALVYAYFQAVRMLLILVSPRTHSYSNMYPTSILDAAAFLHNRKIGCVYMRMALPLYLVSIHSSCGVQQSIALNYLEMWKESGLMAGISSLALERILEVKGKQNDSYATELLGRALTDISLVA